MMKIQIYKIAVCIACAIPFVARANSQRDTLFMKDNTIRLGTITARDSAYTRIKTDFDNLVVSNDDIARIGYRAVENLLLPDFGVQLSFGMAFPSQFDFPADVGVRACARYMLTKAVGVYASVSYATWQQNFDTTLPSSAVK